MATYKTVITCKGLQCKIAFSKFILNIFLKKGQN